MNFLAHCLIGARAAGEAEDPALVAGGFLGDFIKGPIPSTMPAELALGVQLHRRVDAYSNLNGGIRTSCNRFPPELRRIAPILVDIIGDHLLTRRWQEFHDAPLIHFTAMAYERVAAHSEWLGDSGIQFLNYARHRDLLAEYDDWQVIVRAMHSITRRLNKSELDDAVASVSASLLEDLEVDFLGYFPEVIDHAADWISTRS